MSRRGPLLFSAGLVSSVEASVEPRWYCQSDGAVLADGKLQRCVQTS